MSGSHPPRLAAWLLKRLGTGPKRESLTGDLAEQFQRGRPSGWYWRQVLFAIAQGAWEDLRSHKLLTVRAVGVGWVTLWLINRYALLPLARFDDLLFETGVVSHFVGWESPLVRWLMIEVGWAVCGWIVGRFHRDHQVPMVMAFYFSVLLFAILQFGWVMLGPVPHAHDRMHWLALLVATTMAPTAILVGGLCGGSLNLHEIES